MSTFTIDTGTSRATPSPVPGKRMTAPSIRARKVDGKTEQPIVMLTAYTMRMAQLLDPHCDMLLVGDSLGQVIYGLPSTIPVTMEMMCAHGAAVVRGSWHALVAVDMPFGSYEGSPEQAFAIRVADHEGNGLRGGQARRRRGDGADDRVPDPSRHPGDRSCRPDPAGGQRPRRLWRARARGARRRARSSPTPGRSTTPAPSASSSKECWRKSRPTSPAASPPGHRHRRVGAMRWPGAGHRRHARHVRAHAALRETL